MPSVFKMLERVLERMTRRGTPEFRERHWLESTFGRVVVDSFLIALILIAVELTAGFDGR